MQVHSQLANNSLGRNLHVQRKPMPSTRVASLPAEQHQLLRRRRRRLPRSSPITPSRAPGSWRALVSDPPSELFSSILPLPVRTPIEVLRPLVGSRPLVLRCSWPALEIPASYRAAAALEVPGRHRLRFDLGGGDRRGAEATSCGPTAGRWLAGCAGRQDLG